MSDTNDALRFPIGQFSPLDSYTSDEIKTFIKDIKKLPKRLKKVLKKWHNKDLDKVYREGGWSARQVIHHIADSHANAYIRFKLAMTENNPTIRPYMEALWAELADSKHGSISFPMRMITATHRRWVIFLELMQETDFNKTYFHPESKKKFTLAEAAALYAWHCNHHLEHVKIALKQGISKKKSKKKEEENEAISANEIKAKRKTKKQKLPRKEEKKEEKKEQQTGASKKQVLVAVALPQKKENSSIVIVSSAPVHTETTTTTRPYTRKAKEEGSPVETGSIKKKAAAKKTEITKTGISGRPRGRPKKVQ